MIASRRAFGEARVYMHDLSISRKVRMEALHGLLDYVLALSEHRDELPVDWWLSELERVRKEVDKV
jgi:hypothetical protein